MACSFVIAVGHATFKNLLVKFSIELSVVSFILRLILKLLDVRLVLEHGVPVSGSLHYIYSFGFGYVFWFNILFSEIA